jgi:hypothetical protein
MSVTTHSGFKTAYAPGATGPLTSADMDVNCTANLA